MVTPLVWCILSWRVELLVVTTNRQEECGRAPHPACDSSVTALATKALQVHAQGHAEDQELGCIRRQDVVRIQAAQNVVLAERHVRDVLAKVRLTGQWLCQGKTTGKPWRLNGCFVAGVLARWRVEEEVLIWRTGVLCEKNKVPDRQAVVKVLLYYECRVSFPSPCSESVLNRLTTKRTCSLYSQQSIKFMLSADICAGSPCSSSSCSSWWGCASCTRRPWPGLCGGWRCSAHCLYSRTHAQFVPSMDRLAKCKQS